MVDITDKRVTARSATATSTVRFPPYITATIFPKVCLLKDETLNIDALSDIQVTKGAVLTTAIIAGTMAVKNTAQMIPFCHPLPIEGIKFKAHVAPSPSKATDSKQKDAQCELAVTGADLVISCTVRTTHKTGVEMEALTGASVAALTVYDMCKALGHDIEIVATKLVEKTGGKSDILKPSDHK